MRLTEKYELEEEINRLEACLKSKERELERYKVKAAVFTKRTYNLLKYLLTDEEISAWYRLTPKN